MLALVFASTLGGGDLQEAFSALLAIVNDRMNDDKAAVRKAALKVCFPIVLWRWREALVSLLVLRSF